MSGATWNAAGVATMVSSPKATVAMTILLSVVCVGGLRSFGGGGGGAGAGAGAGGGGAAAGGMPGSSHMFVLFGASFSDPICAALA